MEGKWHSWITSDTRKYCTLPRQAIHTLKYSKGSILYLTSAYSFTVFGQIKNPVLFSYSVIKMAIVSCRDPLGMASIIPIPKDKPFYLLKSMLAKWLEQFYMDLYQGIMARERIRIDMEVTTTMEPISFPDLTHSYWVSHRMNGLGSIMKLKLNHKLILT